MPGMISSILGPHGPIEQIKKKTDAHIFLFNVPEVDVVPYLKTVGQKVGALPFRVQIQNGDDVTDLVEKYVVPTRVKGEGIRNRREFPAGSRVGLGAILEMIVEQGKGADRAVFAQRLEALKSDGLLSEFDVLDDREMAIVQDRVQEYNELLRIAARDPRVHLIDVNHKLTEAREKGLVLKSADGRQVRVSTSFTGVPDARGYDGMFSLDGIHPSDTGHAILANLLLEKIQDDLGGDPKFAKFLEVPPIDEAAVNARDCHGPHVHSGEENHTHTVR
jgi:hypothetical protein